MGARRVAWRARLALLLAGLLLGLGLAELGLRELEILPGYFTVSDPLVGWRWRPGASGWHFPARGPREFKTFVQINSLGLRDHETTYASPPGTWRILLLGDSITAGLQVDLEETFSERLEGQLNAASSETRFEVINTAVNGYGTGNELLSYKHDGYRYHAPVVVLVFFARNDLFDNMTQLSGRPTLDGGLVAHLNVSGNAVTETLDPAGTLPERMLDAFKEIGKRYSMVTRLVPYLRNRLFGPQPSMVADARPFAAVLENRIRRSYATTRALILALDDEVQANGGKLIIVSAPTNFIVYQGVPVSTGNDSDIDPDRPDSFLASVAAERGIPFAPLRADFLAIAAQSSEPLFYALNEHLTPAGHRVVADALQRYLRNWGLLP